MRLIDADAVEEYLWQYVDGYEIPGVLYAISKMPTVEPSPDKCWCCNCPKMTLQSEIQMKEGE